jgi:hypothetical protein
MEDEVFGTDLYDEIAAFILSLRWTHANVLEGL